MNDNNEKNNNLTNQPGDHGEEQQEPADKGFTWGDGLSLEVSASKMSVTVEVAAELAENYTADDINNFLQQNNIDEQTFLHDEIEKIFQESIFNKSITVAKGIQPKQGTDGYIDWQIDLSVLDGAKLVEKKGRVDWKERHHVLQVESGQILANMIEPTEGEPGIDIYGAEVPASPGKPTKFPSGKGTVISEDGLEMSAELTGVVCKEGEKITVSPTYNVQGDVSLKSGNVDFDESVVITGDVLSDFRVRAGQDLHINGLVEGAQVIAGGNIFINGGVQGEDKAVIRAGGDVTVKFLNNARVECGGNLNVMGSVTHSYVKSRGHVLLEGDKGIVQGGRIIAEKEVHAAVIGSEIGVKTIIELGEEASAMRASLKEEEEKINALKKNYKKLQDATNALNQLRDAGKLTQEQSELRLKIIRSGLQLQGQIKQLQGQQKVKLDQIEYAKKSMIGVSASQITWPGTIIKIMGATLNVKSQTSKVLFRYVNKDIEAFSYKERELKKKEDKKKKSDEEPSDQEDAKAE